MDGLRVVDGLWITDGWMDGCERWMVDNRWIVDNGWM
jgi:hypothetical protein